MGKLTSVRHRSGYVLHPPSRLGWLNLVFGLGPAKVRHSLRGGKAPSREISLVACRSKIPFSIERERTDRLVMYGPGRVNRC